MWNQRWKQLNLKYDHIFSCDIDKNCIKTIEANFQPKILYTDIRKRKVEEIPDIDLYVFTPPCVTFSIAGKRKGFEEKYGYNVDEILNWDL